MSDYVNIAVERFGNDFYPKNLSGVSEIRYNCPFCEKRRGKKDDDYKLYFNITNGKWHCFKCGARGRSSVVDLSNDHVYNDLVNLFESNNIDNDDESDNMFYISNKKIKEGTVAHNYLISRGINEDLIEYYDLRFGIDEFFGRIIVPNIVYGKEGIWTDMYSARSYINQTPKYKNPSNAKKHNSVFNLHRIKEGGICYVVEGAITAICAGKEACATYGCSPSEEQITMIANKNFEEIYCVYDNDEAGIVGQEKLSEMLYNKIDNLRTKLYTVLMPKGIDAADMGESKFKEYVYQNRIEYNFGVYNKIMTLF